MNKLGYIPIALLGVGVPTCVSVYLVVKKGEDPYKNDRVFYASGLYTTYDEYQNSYKGYIDNKVTRQKEYLEIAQTKQKFKCGIRLTQNSEGAFYRTNGREATKEEAISNMKDYLAFLEKINNEVVSHRETNDMAYKLFLKGECRYEA